MHTHIYTYIYIYIYIHTHIYIYIHWLPVHQLFWLLSKWWLWTAHVVAGVRRSCGKPSHEVLVRWRSCHRRRCETQAGVRAQSISHLRCSFVEELGCKIACYDAVPGFLYVGGWACRLIWLGLTEPHLQRCIHSFIRLVAVGERKDGVLKSASVRSGSPKGRWCQRHCTSESQSS